jgi:dihydroxyacetone kinase-like predicted kinase
MREAIANVVAGEVTIASRDAEADGVAVRKGEYLGLAQGLVVASAADLVTAADSVVERLLAEPRELMTLLTGADAPPLDGLVAGIAARHPELELEVRPGGQPHYLLLISAE